MLARHRAANNSSGSSAESAAVESSSSSWPQLLRRDDHTELLLVGSPMCPLLPAGAIMRHPTLREHFNRHVESVGREDGGGAAVGTVDACDAAWWAANVMAAHSRSGGSELAARTQRRLRLDCGEFGVPQPVCGRLTAVVVLDWAATAPGSSTSLLPGDANDDGESATYLRELAWSNRVADDGRNETTTAEDVLTRALEFGSTVRMNEQWRPLREAAYAASDAVDLRAALDAADPERSVASDRVLADAYARDVAALTVRRLARTERPVRVLEVRGQRNPAAAARVVRELLLSTPPASTA